MKVGIVGKGGTGKTTLSGLLCRAFAESGRRVVAVDTDSNPNLALSLGLSEEVANTAPVVPRALVVGSGSGQMTPEQVLADYGLATPYGVTLVHAMRVDQAGAGCTCSSHTTVRSLLGAALEDLTDVTLVDMEAGLEHLSRSGGTLAFADVLLMVMEPTVKSVLTASRTVPLARELGIPRVYGVGNKAQEGDEAFFAAAAERYGVPLAGVVPFDGALGAADRRGEAVPDSGSEAVRAAVAAIVKLLDSVEEEKAALLAERARVDQRIAELSDAAR
ncbi:MAG: nucleotide-binding protein [Acidimicrobiales bacterium]